MRALLLLLCLATSQAWATNFWLRGPGACANNGNGQAYECATSGGGTGAWVVDRNTNVNSSKWGNTASTVGAGDTLYVCGEYNLPLTGANARNFLNTGTITYDVNNPMVIDFRCPAGVSLGPSVADPAKMDFAEDWLVGRTWTDEGSNIWSTPLDASGYYVNYLACDTTDNLGVVVDAYNRAGYGTVNPSKRCEYNGGFVSGNTTLKVYSEGNPATYYSHLWASSRVALYAPYTSGLHIIGGSSVSDDLIPTTGEDYIKHVGMAIYQGTFSSAAAFDVGNIVRGIRCEEVGICVAYDTSAGIAYYPRDYSIEHIYCYLLARGCVQLRGKFGSGTTIHHSWAKNTMQSYSTGVFYWGGGTDRATHAVEYPQSMHHLFVDGGRYGLYWQFDGHGVYTDEGTRAVESYSNWVQNMDDTGSSCFLSNSAYSGNSQHSSVCINSSILAKQSDSANDGTVTTQFYNLTGIGILGNAINVSGQAGDSPVFSNITASAATTNTDSYTFSKSSTSITPTIQGINSVGFRTNDYYDGSTSTPLSGRTSYDPLFIGGDAPTTPRGFQLKRASQLRRAGKDLNIGAYKDAGGRAFLHPPSIGAWEVREAARRTAR